MDWMFSGCSSLTSLDLSKFNTGKVQNMQAMLQECSSLEKLDVNSWNTSNVTDMSWMFYGCSSLKSLDVCKFKTDKVTTMQQMFNKCSSLSSLDVSKFNMNNVTSVKGMFSDCSKLKTLNLTNFITKEADTYGVFMDCNNLTSITSNATTPSALKDDTFDSLPTLGKCTLTVPKGTEAKYKAADGWRKLFEKMTGIDELQITNSESQNYNLSGQRIPNNTKGLVIRNGKKVLVK